MIVDGKEQADRVFGVIFNRQKKRNTYTARRTFDGKRVSGGSFKHLILRKLSWIVRSTLIIVE